jgi:hypothetical protein
MSNARIERMLRELRTEPPVQCFEEFFGLVGLGEVVSEPSYLAQGGVAASSTP